MLDAACFYRGLGFSELPLCGELSAKTVQVKVEEGNGSVTLCLEHMYERLEVELKKVKKGRK